MQLVGMPVSPHLLQSFTRVVFSICHPVRKFDEYLEMATGDMDADGNLKVEEKEQAPAFVPEITPEMKVRPLSGKISIWKPMNFNLDEIKHVCRHMMSTERRFTGKKT